MLVGSEVYTSIFRSGTIATCLILFPVLLLGATVFKNA